MDYGAKVHNYLRIYITMHYDNLYVLKSTKLMVLNFYNVLNLDFVN